MKRLILPLAISCGAAHAGPLPPPALFPDGSNAAPGAAAAIIGASPNYQAPQFYNDSGLLARYLFKEGSGTTINDSSGNGNNISFAGQSYAPTWGTDGSLQWTSAGFSSALVTPTAVTGVQTVEVVFGNALVPSDNQAGCAYPNYNTLAGITGTGVTSGAIALALMTNITAPSDCSQSGYTTRFVGSIQAGTSPSSYYQFNPVKASIDNGIHVLVMALNPSVPFAKLYLDGVQFPPLLNYTAFKAIATSGGNWTIGGSGLGSYAASTGKNGFLGSIYGASFSSSNLTAAQVQQDTLAWQTVLQQKGSLSNPYAGTAAPGYNLYINGESVSHCHGCSSPTTQGIVPVAVSVLGTATGNTWINAAVDGSDSNTGYLMSGQPCQAMGIARSTLASGTTAGGIKIMVLHDNNNTESNFGGYLNGSNYWLGPTTITQEAYADLAGLAACARFLKNPGPGTTGFDKVMLAVGISLYTSGHDANVKDVANPIKRANALAYGFDGVVDYGDVRWMADNAALNGYTSNTTCSGGPAFQNDGPTHPSFPCGYQVLGDDLAAAIEDMLNGANPQVVTISATSGTMPITDLEDTILMTGTSAALTLFPCGGITAGRLLAKITNNGSSADTLTAGTEYNGGAQDQIVNGATSATTYTLAAGATVYLKVGYNGDATGSCFVRAQGMP